MIKVLLVKATSLPVHLVIMLDKMIASIRPNWRGRVRGQAIEALLNYVEEVHYDDLHLKFLTPNALCSYRASSFDVKEPETLDWIDNFIEPKVIWDIGANVGLYSIYASKRHKNSKVYAFEPSVLNLELLARNIQLNELTNSVCMVPLPLFSQVGEDEFRLQMADRGGAHSAFSVNYGHDNKPLTFGLTYKTLGVSMDDMVDFFGLPQPEHIKIDVDGIEHLILQGGRKVLSDRRLKSILVELNDDFVDQKHMADTILRQSGFELSAKLRAESAFDASAGQVWNNIWTRI